MDRNNLPVISDDEKQKPALALCYRIHCLNEIILLRQPSTQDNYLKRYDGGSGATDFGALTRYVRSISPGIAQLVVVENYWKKFLVKEIDFIEKPGDDWIPGQSGRATHFPIQSFIYQRNIRNGPAGVPVSLDELMRLYADELTGPEHIVW